MGKILTPFGRSVDGVLRNFDTIIENAPVQPIGFFSVSNVQSVPPSINPVFGANTSYVDGPGGSAIKTAANSTGFVDIGRNLSPTVHPATFFCICRAISGTFSSLLTTANTSATVYEGHNFYLTTTGVVGVLMGTGGTADPSSRRSLDSTISATKGGQLSIIAFAIDSSTTGRLWVNGVPYAVTASGSGAGYGAGTGNAGIGRRQVTTYEPAEVLAAGIWGVALPNTMLKQWSSEVSGLLRFTNVPRPIATRLPKRNI